MEAGTVHAFDKGWGKNFIGGGVLKRNIWGHVKRCSKEERRTRGFGLGRMITVTLASHKHIAGAQ